MKYGYIRVSTREQNIDRQLEAICKEGILQKYIYIDRASGKNFNRKEYQRLLKKMKAGDSLYIKSIDRLGRNYEEILREWNFLTKIKAVNISVLDFPLLNTHSQVNGITGQFLADIVLQILSYVAQIERENTHQRQMEGIEQAKKRGVKFGRPKIMPPDEFQEIAKLWQKKEMSMRQAAKILETNHVTFSRWLKEYGYKI